MLLARTVYADRTALLVPFFTYSEAFDALSVSLSHYRKDRILTRREMLLAFSYKYQYIGMNILLFVPFGLFARLAARKNDSLHTCVLAGFAASCAIELFQLLHGLQFDFGDLTANTLGTLLGTLLAALLLHAAKSRKQ